MESEAGWILRDDSGYYCGEGQALGEKVKSALESELRSILIAMQHANSRGIQKLVVEGDCKKAIDILNNKLLQFDV